MRGPEVHHGPIEIPRSIRKADKAGRNTVYVRVIADIGEFPRAVKALNNPSHVHIHSRLRQLKDN
jgi:hypothetical protein